MFTWYIKAEAVNNRFKSENDVADWIEALDDQTGRNADYEEAIADAWKCVFESELSNEDELTQINAFSLLCDAVQND